MGFSEIVILMAIALILFGPDDLPDIARAIGKIVYEVRKATSELTDGFKDIVESPMNTVNKAFDETTQRTAMETNVADHEPEDLMTYDGKPVDKAEDPTGETTAEHLTTDENNQGENPANQEDDPLAELPSGMVTYEEKGASR